MSIYRRLKLDPYLLLLIKKKEKRKDSKWIKDFNVKSKMLKLLEENIVSALPDISVRKDTLNRTSFAQQLRPRIDKRGLIKPKGLCTTKGTVN